MVYSMPGALATFIGDSILFINELLTQHRILIVADFNPDQILPENLSKVNPLMRNLNLSQRSQYSPHVHRGLLDLKFDTPNFNALSSLASFYSNHFVLFFESWSLYLYRIYLSAI